MKYSLLALMVLGGSYAVANQDAAAPSMNQTMAEITTGPALDEATHWQISSPMTDKICKVDADLKGTTTIVLPAVCEHLHPGLSGKVTFRANGTTGYTVYSADNKEIAEFASSELNGFESVSVDSPPLIMEPDESQGKS